jgi:hypothetical protein
LKGVIVKQGYRLIVVDKDGVLVSEFQLTEQALAAPEAFVVSTQRIGRGHRRGGAVRAEAA